ncbi:helix-turn-helix domain-containing protein [Streptomyces kunmingensis]|uniref:Helix-turn-helix domain-containing protein n=1 Tax=Streptomyces kunmingensis TaxID=68225 RepID=A0ABU6CI85_9ACTN|nr:helix-turn-helix transcriptional regulator [Streptomyces kunmingensis]MEB3964095.1 helix-turn-helix domain-containing protein [Streptomyces kunmingensis]
MADRVRAKEEGPPPINPRTQAAEVRAHRLTDIRKRQHVTQVHLAKLIGVTRGRISQIENGGLERAEVETLAAYVTALGGRLKLVAGFGDESLVLG